MRLASEISANWRLRLELLAGALIVAVLAGLVTAMGITLLNDAAGETRRLNDVNIRRMHHLNLVLTNMMASGREQQSAVLFDDPVKREENIRRSLDAASEALSHAGAYRATLTDPADIARWDVTAAQVEEVVVLRTELFEMLRDGDTAAAEAQSELVMPVVFDMNAQVASEIDEILASSDAIVVSVDDTVRRGRFVLVGAAVLLTALGGFAGIVIARHVSRVLGQERRHAAATIAENERRLNAILSSLDEAVWSMALPARSVLYLNPAARALLLRSDGDGAGDPWTDMIHPGDRSRVESLLDTAIRSGSATGEFRIEGVDGEVRWLAARAYVSYDALGHPMRLDAIATDITERRRADEALLQAQKLESLGVLAGGIAHDFNNLLVGILGNASLASRMLPAGSQAEPILHEIELAGHRASDLVAQMLAYSGRGQFRVERLQIGDLVDEMTSLLRASISKSAVLECACPPGLPAVEGDATQLRQVIMNLVVNASEALEGQPGSIRVTAGATTLSGSEPIDLALFGRLDPGEYVYIEVTDTGCGMDEDTRAKIFEPFFTTKFTGRGLGMAAVLGIVRAHRGAITLKSRPGAGSTFRVLLPAAATGAGAAIGVGTCGPPAETTRGHGTVLLVDDEDTVRAVGTRALELLGFAVATARDGGEALDRIVREGDGLRCVLADVTMPGMDGPTLLARIRTHHPRLPVILMSGYAEQDIVARNGDRPDAFLQKPFTVSSLGSALDTALAGEAVS